MTIAQRNLIADYILKIKQKQDAGSEKIKQLERNGMLVTHISELSNLRSDILIFSSVYGPIDIQNTLPATLHEQLDTADCQLYSVFHAATQKIFICNSIPWHTIERLAVENRSACAMQFAQFLIYAKSLTDNLNIVAPETTRRKNNSIFLQEVGNALQPFLENGRMLNQCDEDLPALLTILPSRDNDKKTILSSDGFLYSAEQGAYLWEDHVRKYFKESNYILHAVWSNAWWRNTKQEARKLAGFIIKQDNKQITDSEQALKDVH